MLRLDGGRPIRDALAKAGLSIPQLSAKTKEIDPSGDGISTALIGFYVSTGSSARETASKRTAELMAEGLNTPLDELFAP